MSFYSLSNFIALGIPVHFVMGRSSHTGSTLGRSDVTILHSSEQALSLNLRHSSLAGIKLLPLASHKPNTWRQRNGCIISTHCWVRFSSRNLSSRLMALFSPCCWSMAEGMFRDADDPEEQTSTDSSEFAHICPKYGTASAQVPFCKDDNYSFYTQVT